MEYRQAFLAYDTLCRITAELPGEQTELLDQCEEEAHQLERTLSMFDPDSELSRLCRDAVPGKAAAVSPILFRFLEENLTVCRLSHGAFDPTVGRLVKLWDFLSEQPRIPPEEEVRSALARVGYQHIALDRETHIAALKRHAIRLVGVVLIMGTWVEGQHLAQHGGGVGTQRSLHLGRHDHREALHGMTVDEARPHTLMAIGISHIRLDVENGSAIHEIGAHDVDDRPFRRGPLHMVEFHRREPQRIGAER